MRNCYHSLNCVLLLVLVAVGASQASPQFAIYSLTMTSPNSLNVFSGDSSTGNIAFVKSVPTGGNGVAVESQSSVAVYGNYIFTVNPLSNSLSLFSIDPSDPTNVTLLGTAPSEGEFPDTVTASTHSHFRFVCSKPLVLTSSLHVTLGSDANATCVANTGKVSTIACFNYSASGLSLISGSIRNLNLSLTTPPGHHMGPGQIAFTPDGSGLIVAVKGRNPPLYLFPVTLNGGTFSLSQTPAVSTSNGHDNFALAFDSSSTMVVVDTSPYRNGSGMIGVSFNTMGAGAIKFQTSKYMLIPNQKASCWIAYSSQTSHFYIVNAGSFQLTEVARSGNSFSILRELPLHAGPLDLVILNIGGQDYLYVNTVGSKEIGVLKLGGTFVDYIPNHGSTSGIAGYVASPSSNCRKRA